MDCKNEAETLSLPKFIRFVCELRIFTCRHACPLLEMLRSSLHFSGTRIRVTVLPHPS